MIQYNISLGKVADIAEVSKYGVIDFSVPHNWSVKNPNTRAVWFYSKRSRIFGRPLTVLTLLRLARHKCKDRYNSLQIQAGIDSFAEAAKALAA
jgi:hypothetical protein